jgi:vitamin B12 transporter
MTKKIALACLLLSFLGVNAQSDSTTKGLNEIVVTANRFPQKQLMTGKIMTVITRKDIEESPFTQVGELLNRQAGINVIGSNNAPGANPDLYMRGAGTGNVLVLVDGNPAYDASTIRSTFDLNFIPLGEIERIEILKGGQSTVYGSDAVAGVINIITKKNEGKKIGSTLHLSNASYKTNTLDYGFFGSNKRLQYKLQYQRLGSKGFSSATDTASTKTFDKDGMKQRFYRTEIGSLSGKNWEWKTSAQLSKYENDLDETRYEDAKDSKVTNNNLQLTAGITKKIKGGFIKSNFSINNSERNYVDDSLFLNGFSTYIKSDFTGRSYFAEIFGTYKLSESLQLFAGADHRWQNTDQYYFSTSSYGEYSTTLSKDTATINVSSVMGSIVYNGKKGFNLESGVRYNNHSMYGNNFTYTINPSYVFQDKLKFSFNLSSAFKSPTLYQLYDGYSGEKSLKPETSVTSELSVQLLGIKNMTARATVFNRNTKNGIDYNYEVNKYFNYNAQSDNGLELETGYRKALWNISANYTFLKGNVTTTNFEYDASTYGYIAKGDTIYSHLFRVPQHSLNATAGIQINKKFYVSLSHKFSGKRFEPRYAETPLELKPYHTTDVFGQYSINKNIRLYASLKNIFNSKYEDILGYNTRGRNYVFGVRLGF